MEFLDKFIEMILSPEFYAVLGALSALLVGAAKLLQAIGNLRGNAYTGTLSGKMLWFAGEVGKIAEWLAPGNADEKNHPDAVKTVLHWFKRK